jgi:aryl-alcohol dehydrogenase-like predicted oxidoreductase
LLSKVRDRGQVAAAETLRRSLDRMGVSTIDLVLLHNVSTTDQLDQALGADGAIVALEQARSAAGQTPDPVAALRWALSQPPQTLTIGMKNRSEIDRNVDTTMALTEPLGQAELDDLVEQWRYLAVRANFYWRP